MTLKVPCACALTAAATISLWARATPAWAQDAPQASAAQAQPPSAPQQPPATFEVGTAAVLLDVVVRDKNGRPMRDLTAAAFEIYEDSVRQDVTSFQAVSRGLAATRSADAPPRTVSAPVPQMEESPRQTLIAIIFDRLTANARQLAHKAALAYLEDARRPDDLVGVFAIDIGLKTLQAYTTEAGLIRRALDRAASLGSAQVADLGAEARALDQSQESLSARQGAAAGTAAGPVGSPEAGATAQQAGVMAGALAAQQALQEMALSALRTYETLEREQHGYATTNGLMAVVNSMRQAPGRKTVLFFSQGVAIPTAVEHRFRSVIDTANRGNVSIYTMDASGLRVESTTAEARAELQAAASRRLRQVRDEGGVLMKDLERQEDRLRSDPHSGLGRLAEETGGFLIRDTNDLTSGVRRIDEDMRFHYLLAYSPSNQDYDGRFRTISVKVTRPGAEVQARKGYYAIRSRLPTPVLAHEAPALAALDRTPAPHDFPVHARALSFPQPSRPGLAPVLVAVPGNVLSYQPAGDKKSYQADFTIVIRIRDNLGRVVQKLSQHYPVTGPLTEVEAARRGEVLFYRETELPPGRYTVDAAVWDALTQKGSVHTSAVEVPPVEDGKLRMSSIVVVQRAERLAEEERKQGHPLALGEVLIYPNLDEPISKSERKELSFFLTAYAGRDAAAPKAMIEIFQGGRRLAQAPAELPPPDSERRIQHVGGIPLGGFPAGQYELRIVLSDNETLQARSVPFTIAE